MLYLKMSSDEPFFDKANIQEIYQAHRKRLDNPNDTLENPVFLELAGALQHLDIIDLGCGDALFGQEALAKGAGSYLGIELSKEMVELAKANLLGTTGKVRHERIEDWRAEPEQANLACSRLSLNYIEDLSPVFREVYKALRAGGRFVVSIEHPVISSNYAHVETGLRTSWVVDDYFKSGARVHTWHGEEVTKYHHTLEGWLWLFKDAGFQILDIRESHPQKENFQDIDEYERRLRIPLFLFVSAQKV